MSSAGEISVIMPIKGDAPYLATAFASVLRQAMPVAEVVVIDDGMAPEVTGKIDAGRALGLDIRVTEGPRTGPAAARNRGFDLARGDIIAFLDDDDVWPADKLARQVGYLQRNPNALAIGGRIHWFYHWDAAAEPVPSPKDMNIVHVNLGAYVLRRALLDQIGRLDEGFVYSEDVDFILRMVDSGQPFAILDDIMLHYRRHPSSMTNLGAVREMTDFRRALFSSLKRRRGRPGEPHPGIRLEKFVIDDRVDAQ